MAIQSLPAAASKPKLLDQVRMFMRARRYSLRTEQAYLDWIRRFILFNDKRHPRDLGEKEITDFLTNLAAQHHVAASTQNQALSALLFLYQQFFERKLGRLGCCAARYAAAARAGGAQPRGSAGVTGACVAAVPAHCRSYLW